MKMTPEVVRGYIKEEIKELEEAKLEAMKKDKKGTGSVVKNLEKAKLALEAKLKAALDDTKKDDAIYFEESGIDHLFVDEGTSSRRYPSTQNAVT